VPRADVARWAAANGALERIRDVDDQVRHLPDGDDEREQAGDHFEPRGTFVFVLLMLLGYAIYWGYMWFIVAIERS
jgi:hypothetical protein